MSQGNDSDGCEVLDEDIPDKETCQVSSIFNALLRIFSILCF